MYATDLRDQLFAAALPLKPLVAWCGSACSVTVAVPPAPAIEGLAISSVSIELSLPSGEVVSASATQKTGTPLWTATFAAANFATAGLTTQGFTVYLGGKDETGADRVWIVAKGDLDVRAGDAAPSPGGSYYIVKLRDSAPANPVAGDAYLSAGKLHIYSGTAWTTIGGADPSDDDPLMDGAASAGESEEYARGDHRHPSDTAKLDGAAAYPAWEAQIWALGAIVSYAGRLWRNDGTSAYDVPGEVEEWVEVFIKDLKQDALSSAQLAAANSGATAAKVATWDGYAAQIAQKANTSDLPYAIALAQQTGGWQFSGIDLTLPGSSATLTFNFNAGDGEWTLTYNDGSTTTEYVVSGSETDTYITFSFDPVVTATRAYVLADRAVNAVSLDAGAPLQLPARVAGKARDLLVRMDIDSAFSGSVDWVAPTGEQIVKETEDGTEPFPETIDADMTVLFSWTETKYDSTTTPPTSHWAVSMKPLAAVTQGGS